MTSGSGTNNYFPFNLVDLNIGAGRLSSACEMKESFVTECGGYSRRHGLCCRLPNIRGAANQSY